MFVNPVNKSSIVSFIHGFEQGINEIVFTSELKEYLKLNHDVHGSNQGWPRQIKLYSEQRNIEWKEAFVEVATYVLKELKGKINT